ncbi:MAG TPA: hypothetical protein VGL47_46970 [Amycolatopsis sp.]|uniref:hypothetical protein n=1 Tax=Amycolatopsis sp. TaxID=37632 RepID=UPI002F40C865
MRRWLVRATVLAVVVYVLFHLKQIGNLAGLWLSGKTTGDTVVAGLSARAWGRIGKVMQYVAGFTVVLDIIGAKRLTAKSDALTRRRQELLTQAAKTVKAFPVAILRRKLSESIVFEQRNYVPQAAETILPSEVKVSQSRPPRLAAPFRQPEVDAWHASTLAELPKVHQCAASRGTPGDPACGEHRDFVSAAVDKFLRERLPAAEWSKTAERKSLDIRRGLLWFLTFLLLVPPVYVGFLGLTDQAAKSSGLLLLGAIACGLIGLGTAHAAEETPGGSGFFRAGLWLRTAPIAGLLRLFAKGLAKAPGNQVKWFAVRLALVGFGLDLFAS